MRTISGADWSQMFKGHREQLRRRLQLAAYARGEVESPEPEAEATLITCLGQTELEFTRRHNTAATYPATGS